MIDQKTTQPYSQSFKQKAILKIESGNVKHKK
jgi:hypothetical protein